MGPRRPIAAPADDARRLLVAAGFGCFIPALAVTSVDCHPSDVTKSRDGREGRHSLTAARLLSALDPSQSRLSPTRTPIERDARRTRAVAIVIAVVGVVVTLVGSWSAARTPGVYWSEAQVRFLAPASATNPNVLRISPSSMVMVAGAVRRMVEATDGPRLASPTVRLVDTGVRNGSSVTLPNTGGQWANNFASPVLDVQAVGPSAVGVEQTMQRLIGKINTSVQALDAQANVDRYNLITTQVSPLTGPPIYYQKGSPVRAATGTLALGILLTTVAIFFFWRVQEPKRRGRMVPSVTSGLAS